MQLNDHKDLIIAFANKLGFELVGFARLDTPLEAEEHYREWMRRGFHADMSYMESKLEQRFDPTTILDGNARSVIVLGLNYNTDFAHPTSDDRSQGKVSRYAWGDDYHLVIPPLLEQLSSYMRELSPGLQCKHYVDTGAVLEKHWAVQAGIGWQGKHSNIISRSIGSFFFLAVIFCSEELQGETIIPDYCGTCTACMDACPTQAIVEPMVVDAGRCLSYWTIESRADSFPTEIRENLDGWIYGCDVCQDVCPWNRFSKDSHRSEFQPRSGHTSFRADEIAQIDTETYQNLTRHSALKRAKQRGLQRNANMLIQNRSDSNNASDAQSLPDE